MKKIFLTVIIALVTISVLAQTVAKRTSEFNLENKIAIQGYDPVAYFKQSKGIKGKKELTTVYQGVEYHFSSVANKELFLKTPTVFEPQFGGWCAYAMGDSGEKVDINPETFKILDGKLYLFYNAYFSNTLKSWNKDEANLKKKAESNWKKIY